ncbi:COG4315 family predicted lipoprotein [Actinoallomurus sp. CA-150999]|uniref:COG4315 family predicted lipoprotein n=1 Tax=Actinoallomurus sp. CA-150999 TaxID=3239887 RepID=UPI003D8C88DD
MRNGVIAAGVLALGLLGSACGEGSKTTPESQGGGGPYAQPTSPGASPPGASPTESPAASPTESPSAMPSAPAGAAVVNAKKTSLGTILVDGTGKTLYMFEKDKGQGGKSACTGACAKEWPPFVAGGAAASPGGSPGASPGGSPGASPGESPTGSPAASPGGSPGASPSAGPGVDASKLSTATRPDGSKQLVYNGWPLYYYDQDKAPGDMKGQGVTSYGAPWYVVDATTGAPITRK